MIPTRVHESKKARVGGKNRVRGLSAEAKAEEE